jgi:hypothetical protein
MGIHCQPGNRSRFAVRGESSVPIETAVGSPSYDSVQAGLLTMCRQVSLLAAFFGGGFGACNAPITFDAVAAGGGGVASEADVAGATASGGAGGHGGGTGSVSPESAADTAREGAVPGGCSSDSDCATATPLQCDPVSGYCVQCLDDARCALVSPRTARCSLPRKVCVQCLSSADCSEEAPTCSPGGQCMDDIGSVPTGAGGQRADAALDADF